MCRPLLEVGSSASGAEMKRIYDDEERRRYVGVGMSECGRSRLPSGVSLLEEQQSASSLTGRCQTECEFSRDVLSSVS